MKSLERNPAEEDLASVVLAQTRAMQQAACEGRWEELEILEAERRPLLERLFADLLADGPLAALAREVVALDRQTVAKAESTLAELRRGLVTLAKGQRALCAYAKESASGLDGLETRRGSDRLSEFLAML